MGGLLSLAYMAELGTVFNLAYAELTKGRYTHQIERLSKLPALFAQQGDAPFHSNISAAMTMGGVMKQVEDLSCRKYRRRGEAWDQIASEIWDARFCGSLGLFLYRGDLDRYLAFFAALVGSLIVVVATISDNVNYLPWTVEKPWEWMHEAWFSSACFVALLISMILPFAMVVFGRRVARVSKVVVDRISDEWNKVAEQTVDDMLPKEPIPHP